MINRDEKIKQMQSRCESWRDASPFRGGYVSGGRDGLQNGTEVAV